MVEKMFIFKSTGNVFSSVISALLIKSYWKLFQIQISKKKALEMISIVIKSDLNIWTIGWKIVKLKPYNVLTRNYPYLKDTKRYTWTRWPH